MSKNNFLNIDNFFVGELYLYKSFGNFINGIKPEEEIKIIENFTSTRAINFQQDLISRYIDWDNLREYNGFLTIFYKQGDNYICLHNGKSYKLNGKYIIDNLVSLKELLPKIDTLQINNINFVQALNIFDLLFQKEADETRLYLNRNIDTSKFYVGDISIKERTAIETSERRIEYLNLTQHIMLNRKGLELYSYVNLNYINTVYRCLFLLDGVDLYNINDNQFYNPNEDNFDNLISLEDYLKEFEKKETPKTLSIPKALRLFKRNL